MNLRGLVTKSTGNLYHILTDEHTIINAQLRGKFRTKNIKHTNPIAVGDWVQYEIDAQGNAQIHTIENRKNYLIRKSVNLSKQTHIIASNLDCLYILFTIKEPRTSLGFVDRVLVTAEAYKVPAKIIFNKIDLYNQEDLETLQNIKTLYESIGYKCFEISAIKQDYFSEIQSEFKNEISAITGHSGVGKSTFINRLTGLNLKTSSVSEFNNKGKHTTTHAEMIPLDFGGFLIDTPGIKEFGLANMEIDEIQDYFPEIFKKKSECKFHNCIHKNEPKCAVKNAVENLEIANSRYVNYLNFLESDIQKKFK